MPILVERSLFRCGESSLAVTLPKAWTRYFQLEAGDRVEIVANGELVIRVKLKTNDRRRDNKKIAI